MKNKDPLIITALLRNTFKSEKYNNNRSISFYEESQRWMIAVERNANGKTKRWTISSTQDQAALVKFINEVTAEGRSE